MSNARKILIIDDDEELRESLNEQLTLHEEFDTALAATASEGLKQARSGHVDLVLLDVGLPGSSTAARPASCCAARLQEPDRHADRQPPTPTRSSVSNSGANDYVTKPFRFAVLLARIRAQLSQHEQSEDAVFTIGPYPSSRRPSCWSTAMAPRSGSPRKRRRS